MGQKYDIVITSGGIGPTHDDVTIKAVAQALGQSIRCTYTRIYVMCIHIHYVHTYTIHTHYMSLPTCYTSLINIYIQYYTYDIYYIVNEEMFAHLYRVHQATASTSSTNQQPSLRNNNNNNNNNNNSTTTNTRTGHFFPASPLQQEGQPVSTDNVTWPMSDDMRRLALLPEHAVLLFPPSVAEPNTGGTGGTSAPGELPDFSPRDSARRVDERKSTQREWPVLQVYYSICEILLDMV